MRGKRADWSLVSRAAGHQRGDLGRAGRWRGLYAMLSGGVRSGAERWSEQVTINIQWLSSVSVTGGAGVTRSDKLK